MNHEKTFEAIAKLKDIELELHRLKNALEMANKALDAQRQWEGLLHQDVPEEYKNDAIFIAGWLWAESQLKGKNT